MPAARPGRYPGRSAFPGVNVNPDATLTATEAAKLIPRLSRYAVGMWKARGKLRPVGKRGRSPLYRWQDLVAVERQTRERQAWTSPNGQDRTRV